MSAAPALHRVWIYATWGAIVLGAIAASVLVAPGLPGVLGGALAIVMIAIAAVDLREFIIPDMLVLAAFVMGFVQASLSPWELPAMAMLSATLRAIIAASVFWALRAGYRRLRGREGIGLGDVKLAAVAGAWLDWVTIAIVVDIAALAALAVIAIHALRGRSITSTTPLPFGFFFAPAIWLGWLLETTVL
jgi:leader peptidase (prepilin peptidase)/N-methyltransferase